jgi:hypothetical protein
METRLKRRLGIETAAAPGIDRATLRGILLDADGSPVRPGLSRQKFNRALVLLTLTLALLLGVLA